MCACVLRVCAVCVDMCTCVYACACGVCVHMWGGPQGRMEERLWRSESALASKGHTRCEPCTPRFRNRGILRKVAASSVMGRPPETGPLAVGKGARGEGPRTRHRHDHRPGSREWGTVQVLSSRGDSPLPCPPAWRDRIQLSGRGCAWTHDFVLGLISLLLVKEHAHRPWSPHSGALLAPSLFPLLIAAAPRRPPPPSKPHRGVWTDEPGGRGCCNHFKDLT